MAHILSLPALASPLLLGLCLSLHPSTLRASEPLPPPPESVDLYEATLLSGTLSFAYGKDFQGCAALVSESWEIIESEGLFCETGPEIALDVPMSTLPLTPGESLRLCHPDNFLLCSEALALEDLTPPPRLELERVAIEGESLVLSYAKDVEGCAILLEPTGMLIAPPGLLCGVGEGHSATIPLEDTAAYPGLLVMLCVEGGEVCGEPVMVEEGEGGAGCEGEDSLYSAALIGNVLLMLALPLLRRRRPYWRHYI